MGLRFKTLVSRSLMFRVVWCALNFQGSIESRFEAFTVP